MFVDRETNSQPCFPSFLYQWYSPENEVEYLSIFEGKGFNGKIWLLQNQFLFWAGQTCSHTFGNECCNSSFVTNPQKKIRVICTKNQVGSFPHKTFYKKHCCKVITSRNQCKITVAQLVQHSILFCKYLFRTAGNFHLNFFLKLKYSDIITTSSSSCIRKKSILIVAEHPVKEKKWYKIINTTIAASTQNVYHITRHLFLDMLF